jgi:hypothetical protein
MPDVLFLELSRLTICFITTSCAGSTYRTVRLTEFIPMSLSEPLGCHRISSKCESSESLMKIPFYYE